MAQSDEVDINFALGEPRIFRKIVSTGPCDVSMLTHWPLGNLNEILGP